MSVLYTPSFNTRTEAFAWLVGQMDESCVDNFRFAYKGDSKGMEVYNELIDQGCCGFFDQDIIVNGQPAVIGCNYGH